MADPSVPATPTVGSKLPERGGGAAYRPRQGGAPGGQGQPGREPEADRAQVHDPHQVALRLLRERVLARTAVLLELPMASVQTPFAPSQQAGVGPFLGRLIGDQNLLCGQRAQTWTGERIRQAAADAMHDGVAETLDVLDSVGRLDAGTHELIAAVLAEYAAVLARAQ